MLKKQRFKLGQWWLRQRIVPIALGVYLGIELNYILDLLL